MSRIPKPSTSRSSTKSPAKLIPPTTPTPRARTPTGQGTSKVSPRTRTKSTPSKPTPRQPSPDKVPPLPKTIISLRDAIAQKREEARKTFSANKSSGNDSLEDANPLTWDKSEQDDSAEIGRWSLRETIERARSSGNINLCSRDLPCLPPALFEIHLGVTPAPLKSVPDEPKLPPVDESTPRKKAGNGPTWFDAQDLEILKAWSNRIVEIHPEISLFGSLKNIDMHNNNLSVLPETFADLTALTSLDISHNTLTSLPENFFTLPNLSFLNLSHNQLTSLPFKYPFLPENMKRLRQRKSDSFFSPDIYRADLPLPRLKTLDVSCNKINASSIDEELPASIMKLDLSSNPLRSGSGALLKALGRLTQLKEVRCHQAEIGNDAFNVNMFLGEESFYPQLQILDVGETQVTAEPVKAVFVKFGKKLDFDQSVGDPPEGVLRIIVGKKVVKEAWEIEAEKWGRRNVRSPPESNGGFETEPKEVIKEPWEIDAEQGLLTEGSRRRARAATTQQTHASTPAESAVRKPPVKEPWEDGLSAGVLRLRRAQEAEAAVAAESASEKPTSPSNSSYVSLENSKYYTANTLTLTLPASSAVAVKGAAHARSFSVASPVSSCNLPSDLGIPIPVLPLAFIATQSISRTLKVLELNNRRMDQSFSLPPTSSEVVLPNLEELSLQGCSLGNTVLTTYGDEPRTTEPLLPLISKLFPTLRSLDLTYNSITSSSLTIEALSALMLTKAKPLRQLRLRGNRITDLNGFEALAEHFKGNREVPTWKLEELDLRDNEIGKLPAELGLLPLDVLLVDGNTFRVPPRRIWEREGTKGLLSWLRGRLE